MTGGPALVAGVLACLLVGTAVAAAGSRQAERATLARHRITGGHVRAPVPGWFVRLVTLAELEVSPASAWPVVRACAVAVWVALAFASPTGAGVMAVVAALLLGAGHAGSPGMGRPRSAASYDVELRAAVEALSARLRSGSPLADALGAAAQPGTAVGEDLAEVVARHQRGEQIQAGLDAWGRARPGTGAGLVADAVALAGASGGSRARALAGVQATLGERAALAREIRAASAQARASVVVLVVTPVAFATVVSVVDPRVGAFLVGTAPGWACLGSGMGLDLAGAWWMARLLRGLR